MKTKVKTISILRICRTLAEMMEDRGFILDENYELDK